MTRLIAPLALLLSACSGTASTYYVDFAGGSDTAAGTSATTPWRHAPGDPAAQGRAAATELQPGDTVRFKGGVAYRGSIRGRFDGSPGNPITYSGSGFGTGRAIFDGADPVTAISPCPSAAACGGGRDWAKLSLVTFTPPATQFIKFYGGPGMILAEAQTPAVTGAADDVTGFAKTPLADKAMIESGRLRSPALARAMVGKPRGELLIWVFGNLLVRRPVTGTDGDFLLFDPGGIRLYSDRDGRYALLGDPDGITAPGQYAVIAPGRAVVRMPPGDALTVGNGRGGLDMRGRQHIAIRGIVFRHQTAAFGTRNEGGAVSRAGPNGSGLVIDGNRFEDQALWDGKGVIALGGIRDVAVTNNVITNIERGSGVRTGGGTVANIRIANNSFDRLGRTGVAFLGVADSEITGNVITNLRGIHGNGISLYLANRRVRVADNRIETTTRPMTFHGDRSQTAPGDNDLIIERNIFIAPPYGRGALTSWGGKTRGVTITHNVLIGPRAGFFGSATDTGVTVTDNFMSGMAVASGDPGGWTVARNKDAPKSLELPAPGSAGFVALCRSAGVERGQTLGGTAC